MGGASLTDAFGDYFKIILASTPELQFTVFRVRGDVYCREFGYERPEDCPGGLEIDEFDRVSQHCLIMHRNTLTPAGCVRLVEATQRGPKGSLPMELAVGAAMRRGPLHPDNVPFKRRCEISRLAVHTRFRRRANEQISPMGDLGSLDFSEREVRTFPLLSVALFLAATSLVARSGRDHVYAMMEPRLERLLRRSGLNFDRISDVMDYHGLRAAYHIHIRDALGGMSAELNDLYELVDASLAEDQNLSCTSGQKHPSH